MKKILLLLVMLVCVTTTVKSQIFTTSPAILQEKSSNVEITFHADKQTVDGLKGVSSSTPLYAHIGVFTTKSPSTWSYVKTDWSENINANKFTYVSADTWKLTIGDMRTYFGITDATETITHICIIARTADGKSQTADNFIEVKPAGFQMSLSHDAGSTILSESTTTTLSVNTTETATITLSVNGTNIASTSGTTLSKSYTFSAVGSYEIVATANNGTKTLTQSVSFLYINASKQENYPGGIPKMGAVANADGTVTFCIAAPGKKNVILIPSWDNYQSLDKNVMKYQDYNGNRYFWTTVSGLDPNTAYPYYYNIDATINVGDPYAKLVLDPWSDKWINQYEEVYPNLINYPFEKGIDGIMLAVYKGNIDEYDWKVTDFQIPKPKDLIIYEMLFRDFTGTEGEAKGDGTVRKAIKKLPYIKTLGVNAVELMPIMEFNGNNSWGYNTNFYFAPDKAYGTHDDYREFIDKCHQEGIAVILDIVFNQSDGLHPWYQMYPIASNPFYNETAPHAYNVLNDWKQDNALVQQQWKDVLQYWLKEFNVDGFRFDLVKGLGNNDSYGGDTEKRNQSRIDRMKQLHAWIKEIKPDAIHINENLASASEENEMAADGQLNWYNNNGGACQFAMYFSDNSDCSGFYAPNTGRTWGSTVAYAESHDEERVGYKVAVYGNGASINATAGSGDSNTKVKNRMLRLGSVAAQMLMAPGPKMIWQFGELGNEQTTKKSDGDNDTDPKIVYWNHFDNEYRKGLYDNYADMCWLRRNNPDLFSQSATVDMKCSTGDWSTGRRIHLTNGNQELIMVANPYSGSKTFSNIPFNSSTDSDYKIAVSSYGQTAFTYSASAKTVKVPGHSFIILVNSGVDAGVEDTFVNNENDVNVYGGNGEIVINGEYETVSVYSISGQRYNTLNVPAGLYVVNVDGKVTKVIVK